MRGAVLQGVGWIMAFAAIPASSVLAEPATARDLAWGEVLFHFYQEDYIPAITRLEVARTRSELSYHEQESELVLGGLLLGYGMHRRAEAVFESLLDTHPAPSVRDQAWYFLAQVRFQRGLPEEALSALSRVGDDLPSPLIAERIDLEARALLATGRPEQAARLLAGQELPGGWQFFGQYNLGIALLRAGRTADGDVALDQLGRASVAGTELKSLQDKANLALGYSRLAGNDAAGARAAFDRVRLEGSFASRALLGAGWADSARGDYAAALNPWMELGRRDALDAAVQESLVALPYAYVQLDAPGRAVESYEKAISRYEAELVRLGAAIERVENGELAASIRAAGYEVGADDPVLDRYLYPLMSRDDFHQAVGGLRDLDELDRLLRDREESAAAFHAMIEARKARFQTKRNPVMAVVDPDRLAQLKDRREALSGRLAAARSANDALALADARQQALLAKINMLEAHPGRTDEQDDRLRRLRGIVYWQANSAFPARVRRAEKALYESQLYLAESGKRIAAISLAEQQAPREFEGFEQRIGTAAARIAALRDRVAAARERQALLLQNLAVGELRANLQRVSAYLGQARFALAASYDRATVAEAAP